MATTFKAPRTTGVTAAQLSKAASIYEYTHTSASSLVVAFDDAKLKRGKPRGVLTDQEQDILRAALVMSCAGLDAVLKQAIRDCLEHLLEADVAVRRGFEEFIQKRISGAADSLDLSGGAKFLGSILAEREPRRRLIEEYVRKLTGDSLQSADEVMRTAAALGLDHKGLGLDPVRLRAIFDIRNKIIHELDIDLNARVRKRRLRGQADLLDSSDVVLATARTILEGINAKMK